MFLIFAPLSYDRPQGLARNDARKAVASHLALVRSSRGQSPSSRPSQPGRPCKPQRSGLSVQATADSACHGGSRLVVRRTFVTYLVGGTSGHLMNQRSAGGFFPLGLVPSSLARRQKEGVFLASPMQGSKSQESRPRSPKNFTTVIEGMVWNLECQSAPTAQARKRSPTKADHHRSKQVCGLASVIGLLRSAMLQAGSIRRGKGK